MGQIVSLIQHYGLFIVLLVVFLGQLGIPVPAYLLLIITGALSHNGQYSPFAILGCAVAAALCADLIWFASGRKYGRKVMGKLCKISLSPDSCVRQTESIYTRFGPPTLLFCKFIPGFALVSCSIAGAAKTKRPLFLLFDSIGATIWSGSAILIGWVFSSQIDKLLNHLEDMGRWGAAIVVLFIGGIVGWKWWKRRRFLKALEMARISVPELKQLMESDHPPTIVDTRAPERVTEGKIPGAVSVTLKNIDKVTSDIEPNAQIVLYCACPNEVTAAQVAKALMTRGYSNVRPLAGGIHAWIDAGYQVEPA